MQIPARAGLPHRRPAPCNRGDPQGLRDRPRPACRLRAKVHVEDLPSGKKNSGRDGAALPGQQEPRCWRRSSSSREEKKGDSSRPSPTSATSPTARACARSSSSSATRTPKRCSTTSTKYSDLQVTFGVNMVAIADGKPHAARPAQSSSATTSATRRTSSPGARSTTWTQAKAARAHPGRAHHRRGQPRRGHRAHPRRPRTPSEAREELMERVRPHPGAGPGHPRHAPAAPDGPGGGGAATRSCAEVQRT